jgi:RNA polymerase sigma-70 factor (ECF subfamily)
MEAPLSDDDARLLAGLRAGDSDAFEEIVRRYSGSMLALARTFVPSRAVAEEVVQETWLGVINGIDRVEGRSSLKTWIFRILSNRARTRGERESRTVPFSALAAREAEGDDPAVDPDRFLAAEQPGAAGAWARPPRRIETSPDGRLLAHEARDRIAAAIAALPPAQRLVITLRDVEGWTAEEARNELDISETNQRVLLHRARSKVRAALEDYLDQ